MIHNLEQNQSIETESEMTEVIRLIDKYFKTVIVNMLKDLKEIM